MNTTITDELGIIRQRAKQDFEKHRQTVREKINKARSEKGIPQLTEEEYLAAQREQNRKLYEQERKNIKPDFSRIGILESDLGLDWSHVKPGYSDGIKACVEVQKAFARGHGLLFMWGTYGQAKTLIGKILTVQAYKTGKRAAYANMSSVLDDIRLAFDEQEHKTTELLRRMEWWMNRDVLFLDELDKTNGTEWAQERIFQLLDGRYTRAIREEALTIISSNRSDGELDGYIKSRLNDRRVGPVIYLNGLDGRQSMPDGWKH